MAAARVMAATAAHSDGPVLNAASAYTDERMFV